MVTVEKNESGQAIVRFHCVICGEEVRRYPEGNPHALAIEITLGGCKCFACQHKEYEPHNHDGEGDGNGQPTSE